MSHWPILPVLIPLMAAIFLMLLHRHGRELHRLVSVTALCVLAGVSAMLLSRAGNGMMEVYRLGAWPAPFGIVLVLDRLAAVLVAVTALLGLAAGLAAMTGGEAAGRSFHVFLHLQLVGLNGAFLTGDLFNLFVFFEILLLASYVLLAQGEGAERTRAGLAYVIVNLVGSALFLVALGILYGTAGTLNLADLATVLPRVGVEDQALVRTAAVLLVAVFLLKAAALPMGFWLTHVYGAAAAPVACLFAVMTKVGIAALLRVHAICFSAAPFTADILTPWLMWLAIATLVLGAVSALAARRLVHIVASLVIVASGTLLAAIAAGGVLATSALIYYMVHSTLATGALFLLAHLIAGQRGALGDQLDRGPMIESGIALLGAAYLALAVALCGVPPLGGFVGKLMLLQGTRDVPGAAILWCVVLGSGLVVAVVLARAASAIFWEPARPDEKDMPAAQVGRPAVGLALLPTLLLTAGALGMAVLAAPATHYARASAEQLMSPDAYVSTVLGADLQIERERRP